MSRFKEVIKGIFVGAIIVGALYTLAVAEDNPPLGYQIRPGPNFATIGVWTWVNEGGLDLDIPAIGKNISYDTPTANVTVHGLAPGTSYDLLVTESDDTLTTVTFTTMTQAGYMTLIHGDRWKSATPEQRAEMQENLVSDVRTYYIHEEIDSRRKLFPTATGLAVQWEHAQKMLEILPTPEP